MGMKPRPHDVIVASCFPILANALQAARVAGYHIVFGHCRNCGQATNRKTCCILCALMLYRGQATGGACESRAAEILGVSERYVLDIVSGFDQDGEAPVNRDARRIGAKLRRRFK